MSTVTQNRLERRLARLRDGRDWAGYLALENAEAVATRIRSMIGDGQRYTWVAANEFFGYRPEVRTSQIADGVKFTTGDLEDGRQMAHITVPDTYGVWGLDTTAPTEDAARDASIHDQVYLTFTRRVIEMALYVPAGHHLYWVLALEDEREDGAW